MDISIYDRVEVKVTPYGLLTMSPNLDKRQISRQGYMEFTLLELIKELGVHIAPVYDHPADSKVMPGVLADLLPFEPGIKLLGHTEGSGAKQVNLIATPICEYSCIAITPVPTDTGTLPSAWKCSKCDMVWILELGSPSDNGMHFCPGCGNVIANETPFRSPIQGDQKL